MKSSKHRPASVSAAIAASVAALALATAACSPGGSSSSADNHPTSVSTGAGSEKVTLKLATTPESGAFVKKIITSFQAAHPNITVDYQDTNYDDYDKSINLALASDQSPDIVLLNAVGNTVKDKLVLDLSAYEKAYNWSGVYPSSETAQWETSDGTTLGSGPLYAAPAGFSIVGVYYDKTLAAKDGITAPPATLAEFEADLAKAKAAGDLPIQLGNKQGHASFLLQLLGQGADGADTAAKWVFGDSGASFATAGDQAAAAKLVAWQKAGYFPAGANGTDLQGAVDAFGKGQGLFFVDGNWDASKIGTALGPNAGFFSFPGQHTTAIGTSVAYAISTKSKHPDAAAAFLDYLHSAEGQNQAFAQGFMPAGSGTPQGATGVMADIVAAWDKVNAANGLVGFNNNATATMNDTLTSSTQELLAGKTDPAGLISAIQGDWSKVHGS